MATTRAPTTKRERCSARNPAGFNEWLGSQLRLRRMSQRQLAERSGVDHSSISRLVRGDRVPSLRTAMKLAGSIDPGNRQFPDRHAGTATIVNAAARVEYALRADDRLSEADVRGVMLYYLAATRRRSGGRVGRG
jgi:transcriptional regulator with XRE-family HTH domain